MWQGKGTYLCENEQWKALKQELKCLEDRVQASVDKAAEKFHDHLRPTREDTEALNEMMTQALERVFESHLKGLTDKANQSKQSQGSTEAD